MRSLSISGTQRFLPSLMRGFTPLYGVNTLGSLKVISPPSDSHPTLAGAADLSSESVVVALEEPSQRLGAVVVLVHRELAVVPDLGLVLRPAVTLPHFPGEHLAPVAIHLQDRSILDAALLVHLRHLERLPDEPQAGPELASGVLPGRLVQDSRENRGVIGLGWIRVEGHQLIHERVVEEVVSGDILRIPQLPPIFPDDVD